MVYKAVYRASRLFQPTNIVPKNAKVIGTTMPKSQRLMTDLGLIRQSSNGLYSFLPLGIRSLQKLEAIADKHMQEIEAQKIKMPTIADGNLWKKTMRWYSEKLDSFKLRDRHGKDYILCPTHEEVVTDLLASIPQLSYKQLPLLLYQIGEKYRDEIKPRGGLIRARQFVMKDLYSFDENPIKARQTYQRVLQVYRNFFNELGLPFIEADGSSGIMGGRESHEFHVETGTGEDEVVHCRECGWAANSTLMTGKELNCLKCNSNSLHTLTCLEVGHTFFLDTKYSEVLGAQCRSSLGDEVPLSMGCYGLGLTRIIAAAVEVFSSTDQIRWPSAIAPFSVVIIPPKDGSKEAEVCSELVSNLYSGLSECPGLEGDVLLDDRTSLTIGRRLLDCQRTGYPHAVVVGAKALESPCLIELHRVDQKDPLLLPLSHVFNYFDQLQIQHEAVLP